MFLNNYYQVAIHCEIFFIRKQMLNISFIIFISRIWTVLISFKIRLPKSKRNKNKQRAEKQTYNVTFNHLQSKPLQNFKITIFICLKLGILNSLNLNVFKYFWNA